MIGLGCMRLSTARDRDEARAIAALHAALDGGVTFFDTSDAYCQDDSETGHNERLIARALATWSGDRAGLEIATKGGLTRPDGNWIPNGRARHLTAACEASCRALGVATIDLYQLHAPDPKTPLATSMRALASLQRDRLVKRVGLCNVTVQQIEEARRILEIDTVQVELSPWQDANVLSGVAAYCLTHGIRLIAHRPLGGPQQRKRVEHDAALRDVATRHGATPAEIAIAWLADLSPLVVPIPGATRVETATSVARARRVRLADADRRQLDERFAIGDALRHAHAGLAAPAAPRGSHDREIVLIMGLPGAGKSTLAQTLVERGYTRLNRDDAGASLRDLVPDLERLIDHGAVRIVLDNTYVSRKSRAPIVQVAARRQMPLRCMWLSTSVEDAQVNAVSRMIATYGRLLGPEDMRKAVKHDVSAFAPSVQFRYQRELEPPDPAEGFSTIETTGFVRAPADGRTNRALIVWCDGVLTARPDRGHVLRRYAADGWRLLGIGWRPEVADKTATAEDVRLLYAAMQDRLGVKMDIQYCPHGAGPPVCWCRKPLPGLGVAFIEQYALDPSRCVYVGNGPQDPGFARRLGFAYRDAETFFQESKT